DVAIRAAYKQVFGNAYLMESERLPEAESKLRSGEITVAEFVGLLAKSERYRTLFFDRCPNLRAIELNFKHLLGRAPENYAEISEHICILAAGGFEAEIDSYLNSDEYFQNFGTSVVPYYRGYGTQSDRTIASYTHSFQLLRGASSSDKSIASHTSPQLQATLLANQPTTIQSLSAVPASVPLVSPIKPIVKDEAESFKDLDCRPGYKSAAYLATPVSPNEWLQQYKAREAAATFPAARQSQPVTLFEDASGENIEVVMRAAYKQVFGNAHLMESERLASAESQFRSGELTVKGFIRELALSELYRSRFFNICPNVRAVEFNFKHLLGRAPDNYQEVSQHIQILAEGGFAAEIDAYLGSEEYNRNFGESIVPYYVGYASQTGKSNAGYNRIFQLVKGASSSDRAMDAGTSPQIQKSLLAEPVKKEIPFNPEGYNFIKAMSLGKYRVNAQVPALGEAHIKAFADSQPVEVYSGASNADRSLVLQAAYKQVFGNAYLMESEKLPIIESQFLNGEIDVSELVRRMAKSERYRKLFFDNGNNLRAIELNFKHLLGRAPASGAEISEHIQILAAGGFAAEIDSYIDSEEYIQAFGIDTVPFFRGYQTQTGTNLASYSHSFQMVRGASSSDKSNRAGYAQLGQALLSELCNPPVPLQKEPLTAASAVVMPVVALQESEQPATEEAEVGTGWWSPQVQTLRTMRPATPQKAVSNGYNFANQYRPSVKAPAQGERHIKALADNQPVELYADASAEDRTLILQAAYKQVFGNAHLMESEKLPIIESQFLNGKLDVSELVRQMAKSELYRKLFFDNGNNLRAIELNFKHLLGRAPMSGAEISEHIQILAAGGFEAEIDSYLDSDEYVESFGVNTVPYFRGYQTQTGTNLTSYVHAFQLVRGASSSDKTNFYVYDRLGKALLGDRCKPAVPLQPVPLPSVDLPRAVPSAPAPAAPAPTYTDATELIRKVLKLA
ncbi:MAG: phycobilisome rod-core linker polypeptide, partial [Cyanobacteria bacterium J06641_5]